MFRLTIYILLDLSECITCTYSNLRSKDLFSWKYTFCLNRVPNLIRMTNLCKDPFAFKLSKLSSKTVLWFVRSKGWWSKKYYLPSVLVVLHKTDINITQQFGHWKWSYVLYIIMFIAIKNRCLTNCKTWKILWHSYRFIHTLDSPLSI